MSDLDEFIDAVDRGSQVFAHPDTAKKLEGVLNVTSCPYIDRGFLYAVELGRFDIADLTPKPARDER